MPLYISAVEFLLEVSVPFFNCSNGSIEARIPINNAPIKATTTNISINVKPLLNFIFVFIIDLLNSLKYY
ncbi:hypothetical protein A3D78_04885 [Candidatus Gottesmanbacteria bacterium RIFCSPHIGHO2_02_FULL_39_14]|uniref:Uncharacterized protein n=1 Tax=Candidatus Gottesmanbacteria bacterium RIFCSPHIGHO2_02_FULL_39_14 TaxID=1798383 RepID=A0A1F5ZUR2_9BACT|nr:MAG: hypothetical protein A3D78_04885 [Candidatus Gottesmanbacteria bacterium RIFCSPHIGHO2_02_FULL_39_14]